LIARFQGRKIALGFMVLFNYSTKELTAKVVYYGAGLCGKTTNLQWIHEKLPIKNKGKMLSLATETDRTLFFDFLPIELGTIRGMKTRIQLYTVPGQVFYNATRRMVLKGADCVVFVADSQEPVLEANLESLENLRQNLEANEIDPDEIPMVFQYNKRDLPNALPLEILNERLNPRGMTFTEAVAVKGAGVEETLKAATTMVFRSLATKYGGGPSSEPGTDPLRLAATPPPMRSPAPVPPPPAPSAVPPSRPAGGALRPPSAAPERPAPAPVAPPARPAAPPPAPVVARPPDDDLLVVEEDAFEVHVSDLELDQPQPPPAFDPDLLEVLPGDDPLAGAQPRDTLVREHDEAAEIRRQIGRPLVPDVSLEELEEEEDALEELSFGAASPGPGLLEEEEEFEFPSPARPPEPPAPSPARSLEALAQAEERSPRAALQAVKSTPQPPAMAVPVKAEATVVPVSLDLTATQGQADVAIPLEVVVHNGSAQVLINLRLTLNLRITK
jgi:signal recognition particle receptor subunit beta